MNPYLNNKTLLELALKWKYHLGVIALIAGGIAVVLSSPMFLKPKFKSTSIIYPVNMGEYSEESYTEQMLEILNSGDIRDRMISSFNLDEHYQISPNYKYFKTALYGKYAEEVSFRKTENEAVKITVMDTDPDVACAMVDSLRKFYDKKVQSLHRIKVAEEYGIRTRELERLKKDMDSLSGCLGELGSKYGVLEITGQSEGLSTAYFSALSSGRMNDSLKNAFVNVASKSPAARALMLRVEGCATQVAITQVKLDDAYRELTKEITYSVVVSPPYAADKKDWPKRSVIVLISVIFTLMMAMVVIGVIENRNYTKQV
jgi:LPS O-antigen subunit length determinant protein (WzzB/FepE family)